MRDPESTPLGGLAVFVTALAGAATIGGIVFGTPGAIIGGIVGAVCGFLAYESSDADS